MNRHVIRRRRVLAALLWGSVGASMPAIASETARGSVEAPTTPPRGISAAIENPRLIGQGLLRWFGLRVYDATLWATGGRFDPARPMDVAFALELRYLRTLEGAAIADASIREITRMGFGSAAQQDVWLQQMRKLFPNVRDGDRLAGIHRPGQGVEFFGNDAPIGRVEDPEFARAFFAIWLDQRTTVPDLRRALLSGAPSAVGRADPGR